MLWLNTASYGLTARERAVVGLVMKGFSTAQISAALYISKYTVQEHLCSAFDKVGVRDRQALVKRLFFDNIYPTLLLVKVLTGVPGLNKNRSTVEGCATSSCSLPSSKCTRTCLPPWLSFTTTPTSPL